MEAAAVAATTLTHNGRIVTGSGGGLRPGVADATITAHGPSPPPSDECSVIPPPMQQWQHESSYIKKSFLGSVALVAAQRCRLQPMELKMVQSWRAEQSREGQMCLFSGEQW